MNKSPKPTPTGSLSASVLLSPADLYPLLECRHCDPHRILGVRSYQEGGTIARVFYPGASSVNLSFSSGEKLHLTKVHADGLFEAESAKEIPSAPIAYMIEVTHADGSSIHFRDAYAFAPMLGELDLYLIGEGRHERLWKVLGAHTKRDADGELLGTAFSVWAPNARAVSLICDHNYWDKRTDPMIPLGGNGIWEIFIPGVGAGTRYKFAIEQQDGRWVDHADPLAQYAEIPPATASIVYEDQYTWNDNDWLARREISQPWRSPISVYEMHLGSWRPGLSYQELAIALTEYLTTMGYTHVEFLPVMEHPFGGSWGYQVTGFFAPTSRFGSPDDFKHLVDTLHRAGIGVIMDWVPAHFPKDEWALARFDGTALYEHEDPRLGEHPDWGTLIFNYGRNEVRNFLVSSALYWLLEFHIDGIRVDAVASMLYLDYSREDGQWLPNKFGGRENLEAVALLQEVTATAYREAPGIMMIAEESTAWGGVTRPTSEGGLGFGFKWNMGWMHDTLEYVEHEPVHRVYHHNEITFSILYAWSENFMLPLSQLPSSCPTEEKSQSPPQKFPTYRGRH